MYDFRTALAVWRVILEEADAIAKKRLQAAETYLEKISEPAKNVKASKVHCMKKVGQTKSINEIRGVSQNVELHEWQKV